MRTDPKDADAIETSLEIAAERGGDLTPVVYERLFERQPAMKLLFWRDTTNAIRGEMLMRTFEAILDFIRDRQFADHLIVLGEGRLQAFGPPAEVLSGELIERLYHVPADVRHDPDGQPYVRTLRAAAMPD